MKTLKTAAFAAALLLTASPSGHASAPITGHVSVGAAVIPEFDGADASQLLPYVAGEVRAGHRYLALEGPAVRANLLDSPAWELGPVASYAFGRDADVDSTIVAQLREIDAAVEYGAFAAHRWAGVLGENDVVRLAVQSTRSDAGAGGGWLVTPMLSYGTPVGERLYARIDVHATHATAPYLRAYFGVSNEDATASGLPTFTPDAGLRDVGIAATVSWSLTPQWSLDGHLGVRRLVDDAADSPIVAREGSPTQATIAVGIGRRF